MPKARKIPQRTCIGCQAVRPKRELIRIVRTPAGEVVLDPTGKKSGRGAYICPQQACLAKALAGNKLDKALEIEIAPDRRRALEAEMAAHVLG